MFTLDQSMTFCMYCVVQRHMYTGFARSFRIFCRCSRMFNMMRSRFLCESCFRISFVVVIGRCEETHHFRSLCSKGAICFRVYLLNLPSPHAQHSLPYHRFISSFPACGLARTHAYMHVGITSEDSFILNFGSREFIICAELKLSLIGPHS